MIKEFKFENSSMLFSCSYNGDTEEMTVVFTNGKEYTYTGVSVDTFESLISSPSAGRYFNSMKSELTQK